MMRLFLPRIERYDSTQGEKELSEFTKAEVAEVTRQYAFEFVKFTAYYLIRSEITAASEEMLKLIGLY
jgi:hypothetical protein